MSIEEDFGVFLTVCLGRWICSHPLAAMRKRDLGILLLSAFAIFFSLQNEGSFSYREAWIHVLDDSNPIIHEAQRLPPPVVTDLNGDGVSELLVATNDKIQIMELYMSSASNGFSGAGVLAEASLLPNNVRVGAGRRPVALAAGEVKRIYSSGERRKQVIVVVTAGWAVMCFDHNLKKLWEDDIQEDFPHGSHHKEVAISISNYTLKHGDTGLIIVGGSMEVQPQVSLDPFEEEILAEKEAERHRRSAGANETEDVSTHGGGGKERHFSYYAYAGLTGTRRWSQRSEDFHRDSQAVTLTPQHNYKLDASSLTNRHMNEVECREFRESVLGVMPHRWDRRDDTRFELAHFRKHRRKPIKKQPGKNYNVPSQKPQENHVPGKDVGNKVSGVLGKAAELAVGSKPRKQALRYVPMITNYTSHWWVPNVVVAHLKEGIEAVHLATGRTVCKLLLLEGGLHADVNGDGVLDHVQAVGGHGAERVVPKGMTEAIKPCWAVVTSGVPVKELLFNSTICRHSPFLSFSQAEFIGSRAFGRSAESASPLEVATPVLLPRPSEHHRLKNSGSDVIFFNSRGEVTSFSFKREPEKSGGQEARRRWQLITAASWSNPPAFMGVSSQKIIPTLKAIHLRKYGPIEAILVAGEVEAVVLSPNGDRLTTVSLPSPPVAPLMCTDFSGDGLNDLILLTQHAIFGYVQTRQPGAILFSTLLGILIVVMAVIFLTQNIGSGKGKQWRQDHRSGDLSQMSRS